MAGVPTLQFQKSLLCLALLAFLAVTEPCPAQTHPLTLAQVQRLIKIHAPDELVAREVTTRGLTFAPDSALIERLASEGAGKATVTALKERIPRANLDIRAQQGSQITVDSSDMGAVGPEGYIVLSGILAGKHTVTVQQSGYSPKTVQLTLAANETKQLPVTLDWAGGYLTVKVNQPGATITVSGLGTYHNAITALPVQPGQYQVAVTQDGMKSESRTLELVAGQRASLEFSLSPDPNYVQNGLNEATHHLDGGDPQGAIQIAQRLLATHPANGAIEAFEARVYLQSHDYGSFHKRATQALLDHGTLRFVLFHEHIGLTGDDMHRALLTLTSNALNYDALAAPCKYQSLNILLNEIRNVQITDNSGGFFEVHHLMKGTFLLHLVVKDPENPKAKHPIQLSFATPESRLVNYSNGQYIYSPAGSKQELDAIAGIIQETAQRGGN